MNETINPWKIKQSTEIYNNPWIKVIEHKVITPGGADGIYGVVHFHNIAIGAVPYENGFIWLVGQYRFPHEAYSWEIPEGGGELGADPVISAKRELLEETGISAEKWQPILEMDLSNSVSDEKAVIFLATDLSFGEASPEECEALKITKISVEQAYEEVENGNIRDSLTVACIYKLRLMKLEGKLE